MTLFRGTSQEMTVENSEISEFTHFSVKLEMRCAKSSVKLTNSLGPVYPGLTSFVSFAHTPTLSRVFSTVFKGFRNSGFYRTKGRIKTFSPFNLSKPSKLTILGGKTLFS